ncbi:MAG: hypothetical protein AB8G99_01590 [Planctomycetaceae bacterium]
MKQQPLSPEDIEETIMNVANLNAPQESADRVTKRVLKTTTNQSSSLPTTAGPSRRTFVAVATAMLAICVVVLFVLNVPSGSVAFAQVQRQFASTKSLQYVEYLNEAGAEAKLKEMENLLEMTTLEANAMKEQGREFVSEQVDQQMENLREYIQELKEKIQNGDPIVARRVWIQGRFLHRSEQSGMGSTFIAITNAQTGESVTLDPERKSCTLLKTQTVLNMQTGQTTVTDLGPNPAENFYAAMTQIPPGEMTNVGEKKIAGQQAVGFQQTEDLRDCVIVRTYWIDKATELPIQIDADVKLDGTVIRGGTVRNMVFNQEIDASLFSTVPPKGYTVREGSIMGLDPGTPAE